MRRVALVVAVTLAVLVSVFAFAPVHPSSAQGLPIPCPLLWCSCNEGQVGKCNGAGCSLAICACYDDPESGGTFCIFGFGGGR